MKVTILGCYAATPRSLTNPSAQVLEIKNDMLLIDCGEGTQVQLRKNKIKFARIKHIFISHLHGDHFFGLPGLIATFHLLGREAPLHIYGPKGIKEAILLLLKLGDTYTNYPLLFHELESNKPECILETNHIKVTTIPLIHRVYTNGFLIEEQQGERKLLVHLAEEANIHQAYYSKLKQGKDVENEDGVLIDHTTVTLPAPPPKSYAYCSDTFYNEAILPIIKKATVLYHESTFLDAHVHLTEKTKHSTAKQAAIIAKKAEVSHLILGHYSTRYTDISAFKEEAETIFSPVLLGDDGKVFEF
ncbi:MAG: ribonuclease Z [Flavobacteriaceae bacterium]|nr:ribonuclease Z [Flavobacteriaceae bacterium]